MAFSILCRSGSRCLPEVVRGLATLPTANSYDAQLEPKKSFRAKDLEIERIPQAKLRPKEATVAKKFGQDYTDYMMEVDWNKNKGWMTPALKQTKEISIHPGAKVYQPFD